MVPVCSEIEQKRVRLIVKPINDGCIEQVHQRQSVTDQLPSADYDAAPGADVKSRVSTLEGALPPSVGNCIYATTHAKSPICTLLLQRKTLQSMQVTQQGSLHPALSVEFAPTPLCRIACHYKPRQRRDSEMRPPEAQEAC